MAEFGMSAGFPVAPEYQAPAPGQAMYELRPLSLGEILDRTFTLYRRRFWLYVGLSSIAAGLTTLVSFVQMALGITGHNFAQADGAKALVGVAVTSLLGLLVYLLAYSLTQAATVAAVSEEYLGRETTVQASLRAVWGKWFRYPLIALWLGWSSVWLFLVFYIVAIVAFVVVKSVAVGVAGGVLALGALVYGVIAYIRNSLGVVCCVQERLTVRQAMKRSKALTAGTKGRMFLMLLLIFALALAAGTVQGAFGVFLLLSHGAARIALEASTLVVTFCTAALVAPVGAIAYCLFYIDQRVRREGYDVEVLMERVTGVPAPARAIAEESPFAAPLAPFIPLGTADGVFSTPLGGAPARTTGAGEAPFGSKAPWET